METNHNIDQLKKIQKQIEEHRRKSNELKVQHDTDSLDCDEYGRISYED